MPNKTDAQILQVVCRQGRQDRLVDLIFAECRLVLFEAETPQPTPEIHNGVLTPQPRNHHSGEALFFAMTTMGQRRIPFWQSYASLRRLRTCRHIRFGQPSTTLADFSRARDSQITFSVTHGWSAFWRGRPWLAGRRIGETSSDVGSSRLWIGWVTKHGDKCARSTCRD